LHAGECTSPAIAAQGAAFSLKPKALVDKALVDKAWSIGADRLFCLAAAFSGRAGLIWINVARGKQMAQG
jgi:hypothetical protein